MRGSRSRSRWRGRTESGRGVASGGLGLDSGAPGFVVEEVKATTEAERVVLGFVEGLALCLGPEIFWVLRRCRTWCGWRSVVEERVRFHLAEFGRREPRPSGRKGEGSMTPFVDGYCYAVQDHCLAVPGFRSSHNVSGQVMETGGRRGERVGLAVELFCDGAYEPKVDANVP